MLFVHHKQRSTGGTHAAAKSASISGDISHLYDHVSVCSHCAGTSVDVSAVSSSTALGSYVKTHKPLYFNLNFHASLTFQMQ